MCYKSDKDAMHHLILEKLDCLHNEIMDLKEKMGHIGLKVKFMKERSGDSFEKLEGKIDCLKGMLHHEMEEIEEDLEDLYTCSTMAQEACPCEECKEDEKK